MARSKRRRSPRRPGYTIAQFAEAVDQTERVIRSAVKNRLIVAIDVNGVLCIPPGQLTEWQQTWGTQQQSA